MHDLYQRGTEETVMEPVAGLQLGDHRVLAHLVGLLAADGLMDRRIEARADRLDGRYPEGAQCLLELDHHHPKPVQELLATGIPGRVANGATKVVEHGKERQGGVLGRVPPPVGELLGLAPAEVLEVGGEAQKLVPRLGRRRTSRSSQAGRRFYATAALPVRMRALLAARSSRSSGA